MTGFQDNVLQRVLGQIKVLAADIERLKTTEQREFRGCRVTHTVAQSIASATLTNLAFNTEVFDYGGYHDVAVNNSRITVPVLDAGVYAVTAQIEWEINSTGYRQLFVTINGGTNFLYVSETPLAGITTGMLATGIVRLNANDYLQVAVNHNAGVGLNITQVGGISPYFTVTRIR